jgi:hypothetical protein
MEAHDIDPLYQKPHPPIRIAANREDTFISAGRQGFPHL